MYTNVNTHIHDDNLGISDRIVRVLVSIGLVGSFMAFQTADGGSLWAVLALVAPVIAATALLSWDPLYAVLGINSTGKAYNSQFSDDNVGRIDRVVRYGISATLVVGFMLLAPTPVGASVVLPLLALPIFTTALTGWCPIYGLLQISTRDVEEQPQPSDMIYTGFPDVPQPEKIEHGQRAA